RKVAVGSVRQATASRARGALAPGATPRALEADIRGEAQSFRRSACRRRQAPGDRRPRVKVDLRRKIADVTVGSRVRRDVGDLTPLAASIRDLGLFHPI